MAADNLTADPIRGITELVPTFCSLMVYYNPLVIYAVQKLRDQQQFRITLSAMWTVLNLIYAGIAFQQGHFTGDVVQIIVFCVPLAVLATFLGSKLQKKISQERFLKLTYVLLLCVGVILLVTS